MIDTSELCRSLNNKSDTISTSYPTYRKKVCGKNCLYLKYIKHKQDVPITEFKCGCFN